MAMVGYGMLWSEKEWYDRVFILWDGEVGYGIVWDSMIRCCMVWSGMVWYDMVWYGLEGMARNAIRIIGLCVIGYGVVIYCRGG